MIALNRDSGSVVKDSRCHVDALVGVAGQTLRTPHLRAGVLVECEGEVRRGGVDPAVAERDAVRALIHRVVVLRPLDLAGLEVDGLHVRGQVLRVDDAVGDNRGRRVVAERAAALDRDRPCDPELADVARIDLARRDAAVTEILVRCGPLVREALELAGCAFRHAGLVASAARGEHERKAAQYEDAARKRHRRRRYLRQ